MWVKYIPSLCQLLISYPGPVGADFPVGNRFEGGGVPWGSVSFSLVSVLGSSLRLGGWRASCPSAWVLSTGFGWLPHWDTLPAVGHSCFTSYGTLFLSGHDGFKIRKKKMTYWLIINQLCWTVWAFMFMFTQSGSLTDLHTSSVTPFQASQFLVGKETDFPWEDFRLSCGALVPSIWWVSGVEQLRSTAQRCQNCCLIQVKESTLVLFFSLCMLLAGRSQPGQMVHINKHSLDPPEQVCLSRWVNSNKQKGESIQCKCLLSSNWNKTCRKRKSSDTDQRSVTLILTSKIDRDQRHWSPVTSSRDQQHGNKVVAVTLGVNSWCIQILQILKLRESSLCFMLECNSQSVAEWYINKRKVFVQNDLSLF